MPTQALGVEVEEFIPMGCTGFCQSIDVGFNSLMAISVLAGEKLVLFGRCIQDLYVGIVQYGLPKKNSAHQNLPYNTTHKWRMFNYRKTRAAKCSSYIIDAKSFTKIGKYHAKA